MALGRVYSLRLLVSLRLVGLQSLEVLLVRVNFEDMLVIRGNEAGLDDVRAERQEIVLILLRGVSLWHLGLRDVDLGLLAGLQLGYLGRLGGQ